MAINIDPNFEKFNKYFPGFSGGKRSLIFIAVVLEINFDVYGGNESISKTAIGQKLGVQEKNDRHEVVNKYLSEAKLSEDLFDFVGGSKFKLFLIEQEITILKNSIPLDNWIYASMENLSLNPQDAITFIMDYWRLRLHEKESYLLKMKARFFSIENTLKPLQWFHRGEDRIVAAGDFFNKGKHFGLVDFNDIDDVKIHFYLHISAPDSISVNLGKIKSLFNNRKAKSNGNSRQCNFTLSQEVDEKINKIAINSNMTRSAVVESVFGEIEVSRRSNRLKF